MLTTLNQANLVTVVVPVYNVEKYLDRCIKSIVNQTYTNLEILLIDDESPDNCPQICEDWAKKDSRIKVIHKKNAGLGYARNTGIENAHGEYVCFVDSDDYIELDTVEKTIAAANSYSSELVIYGMKKEDKQGELLSVQIPYKSVRVYQGNRIKEELVPLMMSSDYYSERVSAGLSCCEVLIASKAISRLEWRLSSEREIISEDVYSLLKLYAGVKSVVIIPEALYHYCQNEGSLTKTYRADRWTKIKAFYESTVSLIKSLDYPQSVVPGLCSTCISYIIGMMKTIAGAEIDKSKKIDAIKEIICDKECVKIINGVDIRKQKTSWKAFLYIMKLRMPRILLRLVSLK